MHWIALFILWLLRPLLGSDPRVDQSIEILALRQQLAVTQRKHPKPKLDLRFKLFWLLLRRIWTRWKDACVLVQPETVIAWHRAGFKLFWKWKSRKKPGRPPLDPKTIALIQRMAKENPGWGGSRIHGELAKLGIRVSEATVHRYVPKRPPTPKQVQSWKNFLHNHRESITAMDFIVVPTWHFQQLYVLVILHHGRRLITHFNVTANPTAEWVRHQLREAFPFDETPKYLIHDRDAIFSGLKAFITSLGIKRKLIGFRSPWQNGALERMNGTLRRELLDHVIVKDEEHLRRLLKEFVRHYHEDRTHLGLDKDTPKGRPVEKPPNATANVIALPRLGGLTHRYTWKQAA